jgi:hypothetical protein
VARGAAKDASPAELLDCASLAALALIAHELNNITVPLDGFAEYALQHVPGYGVARGCIQEVQIGIGRIRALASDLESLGQTDSVREAITLGACMSRALADVQQPAPPIEWCCPGDIQVKVDPMHAQRAIDSLIRVATATDSPAFPGVVMITQESSRLSVCGVCSASLKREGDWVFLQTTGIRRLNLEILRDPFRSRGGGRTSRRLALAVLECCAHRAGGHVSLDQGSDCLTLALPIS